ncbi:serine/threonine-protein kinase [Streptomyces sp. NPDC090798]|uniref:serine/threonine-protein kinase n=1 Tax=Streptomyces sp. NPDC090798 TaxID=3365968 RepID=UPI0038036AC6
MDKLRLEQEWELGDPLGEGGFGRVFEARSANGEPAVVKLIPKSPGAERELLFSGEGVCNVVPIIDSGDHGDDWALVMPRADKSLRQHLMESGGVLPLEEAVKVLQDIAVALADLDGEVVHRDLKPENVLLLDGHWCLADFGLARYADAATATHTWKLNGTSPYVAPERWRLQRATIASDIYSLGITAYEMITGTVPFPGPDFQDQHLHSAPPRLVAVPAALAALVEESLYKAPQARPTPNNVLARLDRLMQAPLSGGLAALAEANRNEATRRAEDGRRLSQHRTEQERRQDLFDAAKSALSRISETCLMALTGAAPTGEVRQGDDGGWIFKLGHATLHLSATHAAAPEVWRVGSAPPFDVIAYATMSLRLPDNQQGYQGRSHSLWYCDAQVAEQYRWFETAFMISPLLAERAIVEPFALLPDAEARAALGPGMDVRQVAWPFNPLDVAELDDFIGRWADWLAKAANRRLTFPTHMPEHPPQGSWR